MKTRIISAALGMLIVGANWVQANAIPSVKIHTTARLGEKTLVLDLYADIPQEIELRSFGIGLMYKPTQLEADSILRFDDLWFLADESGQQAPYPQPVVLNSSRIPIVGGRFKGSSPGDGMIGEQVLLATVVFKRLNNEEPALEIGHAYPDPFQNFVSTAGLHLDPSVLFPQGVEMLPELVDADGDQLPDDYEISTYGSIKVTDGSGNQDGDLNDDYSEWLAGTDPLDPESNFQLRIQQLENGDVGLEWDGVPGRVYQLDWSSQLPGFVTMEAGIPGHWGVMQVDDDVHTPFDSGFYQLRLMYPTAGR